MFALKIMSVTVRFHRQPITWQFLGQSRRSTVAAIVPSMQHGDSPHHPRTTSDKTVAASSMVLRDATCVPEHRRHRQWWETQCHSRRTQCPSAGRFLWPSWKVADGEDRLRQVWDCSTERDVVKSCTEWPDYKHYTQQTVSCRWRSFDIISATLNMLFHM